MIQLPDACVIRNTLAQSYCSARGTLGITVMDDQGQTWFCHLQLRDSVLKQIRQQTGLMTSHFMFDCRLIDPLDTADTLGLQSGYIIDVLTPIKLRPCHELS
jgi:hypothetical protein